MASLRQFARRIRERGARIERRASDLAIETAGAINQAVVSATPVDTGRARANWQASLGAPITSELDAVDPGGGSTIARNNTVIAGHDEGQEIHLTNNLPYIEQLNAGSSSQAPEMFVEKAVQEGSRVVKRARLTR